ncbi:MAG TPA: hypothetical protein VL588_10090 [Bdellovibrionota bacterium]|nr:hypothetical protein [Bdellovibrionota bacterium]
MDRMQRIGGIFGSGSIGVSALADLPDSGSLLADTASIGVTGAHIAGAGTIDLHTASEMSRAAGNGANQNGLETVDTGKGGALDVINRLVV